MNDRLWRAVGAVLLALIVLAVPMLSASAQSTGPKYYTLNPGQVVEWDLSYNGGDNPTVVEVGAIPQGSVGFNVFTNQQWINADTSTAIGKGTEWTQIDTSTGDRVVRNSGNLMWETGQSAADTYHIQVYSTASQPVQYFLTATGAGVNSIAPFAAQPQMNSILLAKAQPAPATSRAAVVLAQAGTTTRPGLPAPKTLPLTGGSADLVMLFGAGAALIAAGLLASRRRSY